MFCQSMFSLALKGVYQKLSCNFETLLIFLLLIKYLSFIYMDMLLCFKHIPSADAIDIYFMPL